MSIDSVGGENRPNEGQEPKRKDPIKALPKEMIDRIGTYLKPIEVESASLTSRSWANTVGKAVIEQDAPLRIKRFLQKLKGMIIAKFPEREKIAERLVVEADLLVKDPLRIKYLIAVRKNIALLLYQLDYNELREVNGFIQREETLLALVGLSSDLSDFLAESQKLEAKLDEAIAKPNDNPDNIRKKLSTLKNIAYGFIELGNNKKALEVAGLIISEIGDQLEPYFWFYPHDAILAAARNLMKIGLYDEAVEALAQISDPIEYQVSDSCRLAWDFMELGELGRAASLVIGRSSMNQKMTFYQIVEDLHKKGDTNGLMTFLHEIIKKSGRSEEWKHECFERFGSIMLDLCEKGELVKARELANAIPDEFATYRDQILRGLPS